MARRLARLTLDNLDDLPAGCRSCAFWELDVVRRERAVRAGEAAEEKESWVSRTLLEWGSCGQVLYVDGEPAGYALFAPARFLPGADGFATAPVSEDAVLLATATVLPQYAGGGLGRVLMQAVVKDLVKRGGIRALEAFGDVRAPSSQAYRRAGEAGGCVLPADYLLGIGFKTHRPHSRYPRMRLELKSAVTWRDELETALERLLGAVRPARVPAPGAAGHRVADRLSAREPDAPPPAAR